MTKITGAKVKSEIITWTLILIAGILRSIAIHTFIVPNNFAPGGITGLSAILEYVTGLNSGIFLFAANLPLLVIAFFFVNRWLAVKSAVSLALSSLLLMLWGLIGFPTYGDPGQLVTSLLAAIAGGVLGGVAMGFMINAGGTNGGTDIVATMIQRKFSATNVAWFIFLLDSTVVVASFFVYGFRLTPVLLAFVEMFANSKVGEVLISGVKSAIKVEIVTSDAERLAGDIIKRMGRGVTCLPAVGMYTHDKTNLLICIVRKRQVSQLREILKNYPESFAYISSTSEVMGLGFNPIRGK